MPSGTHPPFSDHAVSCSTELAVGLQCQQDRKVSANARALVPILQGSLSSSGSLTAYVGIPAPYIHGDCVAEAALRRHTRAVVPIVSGRRLSDEVLRFTQRYWFGHRSVLAAPFQIETSLWCTGTGCSS